jgi:hypothetical protein
MPIVPADWSINRTTGDVRYEGDDHGGASPSYATVIEFHRFLQDLADDASSIGDDEVDITDENPTDRSTDNIITMLGNYNVDDEAIEHLYDGSIIQNGGSIIYDGIVNFGTAGIVIQIIQAGKVLADDWWNSLGGLNADADQGISHRFMIRTVSAGFDIDGRRLTGIARTYGNTYSEFRINGTSRGNNVLALADSTDLNNATALAEVAVWADIDNLNEGYIGLDVNADTVNEFYYSQWDYGARSVNDFYERTKYLSRDGSTSGLYGLPGELFRGITHQLDVFGGSGNFDPFEPVIWGTPVNDGTPLTNITGSGHMLAIDNEDAQLTDQLWFQLMSGVIPTPGQAVSGVISTALVAMDTVPGTVTVRTISTPFGGQSTGGAIIGSYGLGIDTSDLTASDQLTDLGANTITPPNNVTFTVAGLISGEDRVLIGPWDGSTLDSEGNPAIDKGQLAVFTTALTGAETSVTVTPAIPTDTPASGVIRIVTDLGLNRLVPYMSYTGSVFTFWTTHDFSGDNASVANNVWVAYIDVLAVAATATFTSVYLADRNLVVIIRDGGGTPIKQFITSALLGSNGGSVTAIRTSDE